MSFGLSRAKLERFVRLLNDGGQFFFAAEVCGFAISDLGAPLKTPDGKVWQTPFGDLIEHNRVYRLTSD
jgi:hypothetical protein